MEWGYVLTSGRYYYRFVTMCRRGRTLAYALRCAYLVSRAIGKRVTVRSDDGDIVATVKGF